MNRIRLVVLSAAFCALAPLGASTAQPSADPFTMDQVLSYPFVLGMTAAEHADRIAWVRVVNGVRNVWVADGPAFAPKQVTQYTQDDGQEITQLTFSPDGKHLLYVRGGDHDANWPAAGDLAPDPDRSPEQPKVTIWSVSFSGAPVKLAEGDHPALTDDGRVAYIKDHHVWLTTLAAKAKPTAMFFDRGNVGDLQWSPDGKRLAFVSVRDGDDHSFIGVYANAQTPMLYLAPSTGRDFSPRWSKDGREVAFVRRPGDGGAPEPLLTRTPRPWSIWVADAATGAGHKVWASPETLRGSYPQDEDGEANLHWVAGHRLAFLSEQDNWPHLYSVSADGGDAMLLTPGDFMVEHISESRDGRFLFYSANTGPDANDDDRRHVFRVPVDAATPAALTSGDGLETTPVPAGDTTVAFASAGAKRPFSVAIIGTDGKGERDLGGGTLPKNFPLDALVVPKKVVFQSPDGFTIHGQLFQRDDGKTKPGIIFVHGGPPRQMLLGWHYMDYYSNSYAVNQYLAAHGFTVLSVNYRLGIGYGHDFEFPAHSSFAGGDEYKDVLAGARYLQKLPGVDPDRIGIWGGSYGGYLTAMGLAHNSDVFKAGVDFHGLDDWSAFLAEWVGQAPKRYEQGDRDAAMKVAFESSPVAAMDTWKSPVLLIQGDDDRNVNFHQTIDLARRLNARHVPYEEMVIPDEIHGFLRHISWDRADKATAAFLTKELQR